MKCSATPTRRLRTCAEGLSLDPEDAELWFRKGVAHRHRAEPDEAEAAWRRILALRRPEKFASMDQGIYGHVTRRNLAAWQTNAVTRGGGQRHWRAVLAECPGDRDGSGIWHWRCRVRCLRTFQSRKAFGITARDRLAPRRTGKNGAELMSVAHDLYLDLMMRCLTDWIYDGANEGAQAEGRDWPARRTP